VRSMTRLNATVVLTLLLGLIAGAPGIAAETMSAAEMSQVRGSNQGSSCHTTYCLSPDIKCRDAGGFCESYKSWISWECITGPRWGCTRYCTPPCHCYQYLAYLKDDPGDECEVEVYCGGSISSYFGPANNTCSDNPFDPEA
jgi:hypothetical protein